MIKILVLVCVVLFSNKSLAADTIFEEAKKLMNYTQKVTSPKIVPLTKKDLQIIYCPGQDCTVSAVYFNETIYYDERIRPKRTIDRSILIHEYVHHLQYKKYGHTYTCKRWYSNELEAYRIQIKYLKQRGIDTAFVDDVVKQLKCPQKETQ